MQAAPGHCQGSTSVRVSGVDLPVVAVEVGAWAQTPSVDVGGVSVLGWVRVGDRIVVAQTGPRTGWARRLTRFAIGVFIGGRVGPRWPWWRVLLSEGVNAPSVRVCATHVAVADRGGPLSRPCTR